MGLTTDRNDPGLRKIRPDGQQEVYLVLSEEERAKGFVRPFRNKYIHLKCGGETRMGAALSETYARNPRFYGGTMCVHCGTHFSLRNESGWAFEWSADGEPVGSTEEEARQYKQEQIQRESEKHKGGGI